MANEENGANEGFSPPYTSFRTALNTIERMEAEGGVPGRVDRSYLSNLPGSSQTMLLSGFKSLGLIDAQAQPSADLIRLVEDSDGRPAAVKRLFEAKYAAPLKLGRNATQQQLEEVFRADYGITGSTLRKAIAFFLAGAKYAEIPVSPHFRTPKATAGPPGRKPRQRRDTGMPRSPVPEDLESPPATDAKARYVELLLKKLEAEDGLNTELLDRIERVLGVTPPTSASESKGGE